MSDDGEFIRSLFGSFAGEGQHDNGRPSGVHWQLLGVIGKAIHFFNLHRIQARSASKCVGTNAREFNRSRFVLVNHGYPDSKTDSDPGVIGWIIATNGLTVRVWARVQVNSVIRVMKRSLDSQNGTTVLVWRGRNSSHGYNEILSVPPCEAESVLRDRLRLFSFLSCVRLLIVGAALRSPCCSPLGQIRRFLRRNQVVLRFR